MTALWRKDRNFRNFGDSEIFDFGFFFRLLGPYEKRILYHWENFLLGWEIRSRGTNLPIQHIVKLFRKVLLSFASLSICSLGLQTQTLTPCSIFPLYVGVNNAIRKSFDRRYLQINGQRPIIDRGLCTYPRHSA